MLTGLANRLAAEDAGARLLELARRRLDPMSMLSIDLDNLKIVNDSRGHSAGDAHLLRVAQVLTTTLRKSDVIFVSYGKSGRTWLRFMISQLFRVKYDLPENLLLSLCRV